MIATVDADSRLTLAEASDLTGLSRKALARRVERGSLPAEKNDDGRHTVTLRDLAHAGLIDLATGKPPPRTLAQPTASELARELARELTERGVQIFELERGHQEQAEQIAELRRQVAQARRERAELRRQTAEARRERAELRRQIAELQREA
jgi:hypothetical protein